MRRRRVVWLLAGLVLVLVSGWLAAPYVRSAAFILDVSGSTTWVRRFLPVSVQRVTSRDLDIPTRAGPIKARFYQPDAPTTSTLIVFPGIHNGDSNEPRLVAFSRRLAATGHNVLSVPLPDLRAYLITPRSTDVIEDVTIWTAADHQLTPSGRVGLVGISFSGGLALVAAGRPALREIVPMVVSLGGHADLPRTMTYLCTGRLPDGSTRPPHDYGVVIILLAAIDQLVPPAQVAPLRHAVFTFLEASGFSGTDPDRSARLFDEARREGAALEEPARKYMTWVNERNVAALGPVLIPFIEALGGFAALSPDRSPATQARVFLLHGGADNVIPSTETPLVADYLHQHGNSGVEWLLTPLLSHADLQDTASLADGWRLIRLWKRMLDAGEALR